MSRIQEPARDAAASEWTVYADALQEAGDPRGELIALNQAVAKGMSTADRDAYVDKHKQALLGPAAEHFEAFRVDWVGCLADSVEIRISATDAAAPAMTAFLASPLASARAIAVIGVASSRTAVDVSAAVAMLFEQWPGTARSLALVDERAAKTTMLASRDMEPDANLVVFGSLAGVWKLPHLESLRLDIADSHQLDLGAIDAPDLRSFTLRNLRYSTPFEGDAPMSGVLAAAKWPQLREFELRLTEEFMANIIADEGAYVEYYTGDEDYEDRADEAEYGENVEGTNWGQLAPLLKSLATLPLERLALTSVDSTPSFLRTLGEAGLPKTLVELDLSDSSIASTDWFLEQKAMFFSVKKLVLRNTSISDDDIKALADLGPQIEHSTTANAPQYRYVVGQE